MLAVDNLKNKKIKGLAMIHAKTDATLRPGSHICGLDAFLTASNLHNMRVSGAAAVRFQKGPCAFLGQVKGENSGKKNLTGKQKHNRLPHS